METTIRQFQEEVRDILNQDTWFGDHGIDWLAEDSLDIEYEVKKHLGQTGIVAVVTTPNLTYQGEHKHTTVEDNIDSYDNAVSVTLDEAVPGVPSQTIIIRNNPFREMHEGGVLVFDEWLGFGRQEFKWMQDRGGNWGFWNIDTYPSEVPLGFLRFNTEVNLSEWLIGTTQSSGYRSYMALLAKQPSEFRTGWTFKDAQGRDLNLVRVANVESQNCQLYGGALGEQTLNLRNPTYTRKTTIDGVTYYGKAVFNSDLSEPVSVEAWRQPDGGEKDTSEAISHKETVFVNKGFDTEISLQIVENPTVNRGKPDKDAIATALDVGHRAVYTLSGYDTEHYNDFNFTTIKQSTVAGAGNKLLQVDARFRSTPVL